MNERLTKSIEEALARGVARRKEHAALLKERDELLKDKARLDWVQANNMELCPDRHGRWVALKAVFTERSLQIGMGNSIRQAIDEAMTYE